MKITPEAVKERISALESAGELSLKEQFYLEALRLLVAGMDSEPVAYIPKSQLNLLKNRVMVEADLSKVQRFDEIPLYRHAQPTLTPYAWSYDWACCVTCEGPQDFEPVIEREPPPQWAIDEGRVKNLITLYRTAQPAPVVPDVVTPDDVRWMLSQSDIDDGSRCRTDYGLEIGAKMWNACRAAMLNGGKS